MHQGSILLRLSFLAIVQQSCNPELLIYWLGNAHRAPDLSKLTGSASSLSSGDQYKTISNEAQRKSTNVIRKFIRVRNILENTLGDRNTNLNGHVLVDGHG